MRSIKNYRIGYQQSKKERHDRRNGCDSTQVNDSIILFITPSTIISSPISPLLTIENSNFTYIMCVTIIIDSENMAFIIIMLNYYSSITNFEYYPLKKEIKEF